MSQLYWVYQLLSGDCEDAVQLSVVTWKKNTRLSLSHTHLICFLTYVFPCAVQLHTTLVSTCIFFTKAFTIASLTQMCVLVKEARYSGKEENLKLW